MNAIEKAMCHAIAKNKNFQRDNTRVSIVEDEVNVFLFNNHIAKRTPDGWSINLCGCNTPTTRSRLSALLHHFTDHGGVYTAKNQAYLGSEKIAHNDWVLVL